MTICEKYIQVLKKEKGCNRSTLTKIIGDNLDFNCCMRLSKYLDSISIIDDDTFMLKLKEDYGYTKEYWLRLDKEII